MGAKAKLAGTGTRKKPLSGLKGRVEEAGGMSKHRALQGYLPSGYHQNPKKYAPTLIPTQKARIRRMNKTMNSVTFKRVYGFSKK